jgi:hypothetical protein
MTPENPMSIEEIGLDTHGYLFVRPLAASAHEFTYIWRDAAGVRWNDDLRVLHAAEPARWTPVELYAQIIAAVYREYGVRLEATANTLWSRMPDELQRSLKALLPKAP